MNWIREIATLENLRPVSHAISGLWLALPLAFALALTLVSSPLTAQQIVPRAPSSSSSQPPPAVQQQPGAGAQIQTGTASGLDPDARLQNLLADHQYSRIEAQLGQLPPDQAQFYRGILANRSNDLGQSVKLLEPLARHGVSMTRFESRPARVGTWEYYFYIDVEGHRDDPSVAGALAELGKKAAFLKILGSYPRAR